VRGALRLVYADGRPDIVLDTGDFYVLPAGTCVKAFRHESSPDGPAIFVAVHRAFEPQPDARATP